VFTYNRVLNATELQKVQSYMALKYGIAMKQNYVLSNGTLVWDIAANAAHSKEIAALARDNVAVLYQKQAKAFHTDEVVSIASGNILAATNNDNADWVISGNISSYGFSTSGISQQQVASNRLTVGVHITRIDQKSNVSKDYDVSRSFEFAASQTIQQAEASLGDEIIRSLTDDIFNKIFSAWAD